MVIQANIPALNSHRNTLINNRNLSQNLERLSSGFRINRAGDDAAGLAISERMRTQIRGLSQAKQNTRTGINLIQTAEGALQETHAILQRMRELAVKSSNGTYQDFDRGQIELEFQALKAEIDRISTSTHYNRIPLLDGSQGRDGVGDTYGGVRIPPELRPPTPADAVEIPDGSTISVGILPGNVVIRGNVILNGRVIVPSVSTLWIEQGAVVTGGEFYVNRGAIINNGDLSNIRVISCMGGTVVNHSNGIIGTLSCCLSPNTYVNFGTIINVDSNGSELVNIGTIENIIGGGNTNGTIINYGTRPADADIPVGIRGIIIDREGDWRVAGSRGPLRFQVGANGGLDQRIYTFIERMHSDSIGMFLPPPDEDVFVPVIEASVLTITEANRAIDILDGAIDMVSSERANLGATQNRMESTLDSLGVSHENLSAAESTIRDIDMAREMMNFTKNNILTQASQAMLAQANQLPQGILQLLR